MAVEPTAQVALREALLRLSTPLLVLRGLRVEAVGAGAPALFGVTADELAGPGLSDGLGDDDRDALAAAVAGTGGGARSVGVTWRPTATRMRLNVEQDPSGDGTVLVLVTAHAELEARDELRRAQERLAHLSSHDPLTGLANRDTFKDKIADAWERYLTDGGGVAVLLCDLDRFKEVNDAFGQEGGDAVLRECADRLRRCVRDIDTVARLGGDEFVVLCERSGDLDDVEAIASRILAELAEPVLLSAGSALLTASIGICTSDQVGGSSEALLSRAHHAVHQMKREGRNGIVIAGPGTMAVEPPRVLPSAAETADVQPDAVELRPVVERVGDAVLMMNPQGTITFCGSGAVELYGFAEQEMIGRPIIDLIAEAHRDQFRADLARASSGTHLTGVRTIRRHRDGTRLDVTSILFPLTEGTVPTRRRNGLEAAADLAISADELVATVDILDGVVFRLDLDGVITFVGGESLGRLGLERAEVVGMTIFDIFDKRWSPLIPEVLAGASFDLPVDIGAEMWQASTRAVRDDDGALVAIAGQLIPGQATWDEHEAVARSEARFRALVQHSSDLFAVVRPDLTLAYVSPSVRELLGWDPAGLNGQLVTNLIHPDDAGVGRQVFIERRQGHGPHTFDLRIRTSEHAWRTYEFMLNDLLDDPSVEGVVLNGRDVTDRRRVDAEMRRRARHDDLTGLCNRATLLHQTDDLLAAGPSQLAVIVLGLDRFRLINDSMGHAAGDRLLVTVADRLRSAVRPTDVVARIGGDTFVMVVDGVDSDATARATAARVRACLDDPVEIQGRRIKVHASIGVARAERTSADAASLVQDADAAMHLAKLANHDHVQLFDPSMRARTARRLDLEQALSSVADSDQLLLHYQPIVALADGVPVGVEALVRWEHPELGLIPPLDFIPLAEETGHIVEIGAWVLREACRTVARWSAGGRPMYLSVNLSPRQLNEADLPDVIADILAETGLPASQLTMEVTESVLVDEGPVAAAALSAIRELGVRLAIDDFGTGYSSLLSLRRLHVDSLKIDRSFVDGLGQDPEDEAIVTTVINLAHSLGLGVVAEGVETEDQRSHLLARGCLLAQGWLFARPLTSAAFEDRYHHTADHA